jgi:hypothetical protein
MASSKLVCTWDDRLLRFLARASPGETGSSGIGLFIDLDDDGASIGGGELNIT